MVEELPYGLTFGQNKIKSQTFGLHRFELSVPVKIHICVRQHLIGRLHSSRVSCTYTFTPFRGLFRVKIKTCCTKTTSGLTLHRPILVPLVGYDTATITCLLIVTELAHSKRRNDTCNETHRSNVQSHTFFIYIARPLPCFSSLSLLVFA